MNGLFSPDSKFMTVMNRIADLLILNILYLITCIPIFTIGTATTALYHVCFKMGTDEEGGIFKGYFRSFIANFKQATIMWLILMVVGFSTVFYFLFFFRLQSALRYIALPIATLFLILLMVSFYAFPLLSQFQNKTWNTLRNSLLLCIGYLPRSILIAAINLFPFILLVSNLYAFIRVAFFFFTFYFAGAAFVNTRILHKVFSPYYANKETEPVPSN